VGSTTRTRLDYHLRHTAPGAGQARLSCACAAARVLPAPRRAGRCGRSGWSRARRRPLGAAVGGPPLHGHGVRATDLMSVCSTTTARPPPRPAVTHAGAVEPRAAGAQRRRRVLDPRRSCAPLLRARRSAARRREHARRWPPPRRPCGRDVVADRPDSGRTGCGAGRRRRSPTQGRPHGARRDDQRRRLTIITGGLRDLLEARGETIAPDRVVRTMVPGVRAPAGERGDYNNRVSACSRGCVAIDDPSAGWRSSASRWTGSSRPSRRSPATRSPSCRGSRRRCCSRSAAGS